MDNTNNQNPTGAPAGQTPAVGGGMPAGTPDAPVTPTVTPSEPVVETPAAGMPSEPTVGTPEPTTGETPAGGSVATGMPTTEPTATGTGAQ